MGERLQAYNQKRNFSKTSEPRGKTKKAEGQARFVVQHHLASRDHYDLRLEWRGTLLSWAVPKGPSYNTQDKRLAVQVEDHPLDYRHFEGTIPKGQYGGGTVMLWDEGVWHPQNGDVDQSLRDGSLKFVLDGARLQGKWALVRMQGKAGETQDNWLLIKEKDAYSKKTAGITGFRTSVRTGRTMAAIQKGEKQAGRKNPFNDADVQLAKLAVKVATDGDWLYEIKYDGYRILAYIEMGHVVLRTRNGHDYTGKFQPIAEALSRWAGDRPMVLDGEMVIVDAAGKTDFQALQQYVKHPTDKEIRFVVFDLLALDGADIRQKPLTDRKKILQTILKNAPSSLHYSEHVAGKGLESLQAACRAGLEGIIGKRADSPYSGTRNGDWIKLKCSARQEFVIGGYTRSEKRISGISSLLLGVFEDGEFMYAGRAAGISEREMQALISKFKSIHRKTPPFKNPPAQRGSETMTWLKPFYVAEIKFAEWTDDGLLRQASYKGLRVDKSAREVKKEQISKGKPVWANQLKKEQASSANPVSAKPKKNVNKPKGQMSNEDYSVEDVRITSPEKKLFHSPSVTKADLADYYRQVSIRMMPYLEKRLLSTIHCPQGIKACFFRKHPNMDDKGIAPVTVPGSSQQEPYFYAKNVRGILAQVQMNALEFHIWGSRADKLEKPDMLVFDLDPDAGMPLKTVRQGVRDLKNVLTALSMTAYLKTSGGKGYHVVVPLKPAADWNAIRVFAKNVAAVMEQKWPDRYTSNMRKSNRKGKIFIDWVRNTRGATSVAPYSIRARKGAPVSMPIFWHELDKIAPDGIRMEDALKRLKRKDPWEGFFQNKQQLQA